MQAFFAESTFPIGEGYFWNRRHQLDKSEFPRPNKSYKRKNSAPSGMTSNRDSVMPGGAEAL